MISMAAACFHAGLWAGVVVRDVAIQDLTPSPSSPLQPPTRVPLPSLLLAANGSDFSIAATNGNLAQVAEKSITPAIIRKIEKMSLNACSEVENQSSLSKLGIRAGELMLPAWQVIAPLKALFGIEPKGKILTTITKAPQRGDLTAGDWSGSTEGAPLAEFQYFKYVPTPGFTGKDKVGFDITVNGKVFRAQFTINVLETWNNGESCVQGSEGSSGPSDSSNFAWDLDSLDEVLPAQAGSADQWLRSASLAALLSTASQTLVGFQDLAGSSVGQTTGEGAHAQIRS